MEYLVNMTTQVPDGTSEAAVEDIRARGQLHLYHRPRRIARPGVPGPIAETTDEVIAILRDDRFDPARVAAFRAASFDVADGRATPRFIETIVLPALAG